jgi:hypothetical protein
MNIPKRDTLYCRLELISGQKRRDGQYIKVDSILSPSADVHQNCTQLEA